MSIHSYSFKVFLSDTGISFIYFILFYLFFFLLEKNDILRTGAEFNTATIQ